MFTMNTILFVIALAFFVSCYIIKNGEEVPVVVHGCFVCADGCCDCWFLRLLRRLRFVFLQHRHLRDHDRLYRLHDLGLCPLWSLQEGVDLGWCSFVGPRDEQYSL